MPNIVYSLPFPTPRHVSIKDDFRLEKTFDSREGVVELVSHKRTGQLRITKTVRHRDSRNLPREARALARLPMAKNRRHDNIIRLLQCEYDARHSGALMMFEHCSGGDLFGQLSRRRADPLFALHIFISVSEALAFLHHGLVYEGRGSYREVSHHDPIIHQDVKDDNVFIRWGKETTGGGLPDIVLADFGLANRPHESSAGNGCIVYMSPECRSGRPGDRLTTATDIYSFGVMLHRILDSTTGDRGFWPIEKTPKDLALDRIYKGLGFTNTLRRCLAYQPRERGSFSDSSRSGMLSDVVNFRLKRKGMIQAGDSMPRSYWVKRP